MSPFADLIGALTFAAVFLFVGRLRLLNGPHKTRALSFTAGVAVAYVFLDLMPHLASKHAILLATTKGGLYGFLIHHAYLVALTGFTVYLTAMLASDAHREAGPGRRPRLLTLVLESYRAIGACAYVMLIGYMLAEQPDHRREPLVLFVGAMTIHMVGLAHYLRDRMGGDYDRFYRWAIATSALAGWVLGRFVDVPETTYALWFAFLAGGLLGIAVTAELIVVDSFRNVAAFAVGAGVLCALILLLEVFGALEA